MRKTAVLSLALLVATLLTFRGQASPASTSNAIRDPDVTAANDRKSAQLKAELELHTQCMQQFASPWRQRALWDSGDVDALLVGSLASNVSALGVRPAEHDRIPADDFLRRLVVADPHDEIYLQRVVSYCKADRTDYEEPCALGAEARLTELRPGNGFYWMLLGEKQYRDGDREAALRSFRIASDQNLFSVGWGARIGRFYRTELALFPEGKSCALLQAVGIASADLPGYATIIETCRENLDDARWVGACIGLGGAMEYRGRTLMTVKIGLAMQQAVYEAMGADMGVALVLERKAALNATMRDSPASHCFPFQSVESERAWIARVEAVGEVGLLRESIAQGRCPL